MDHITIIAFSYMDPICDLYRAIYKDSLIRGYAQAIIVLCEMMMSSILNRLRYDNGQVEKKNEEFLKEYTRKHDKLEMYEDYLVILVLRNIIAHNHIWYIKQDEAFNDILFEHVDGYQNKNFKHVVDMQKRMTKRHGISVVSTSISLEDVKKVLMITNSFINAVVAIERSKNNFTLNPDVLLSFDGEKMTFNDFISKHVF